MIPAFGSAEGNVGWHVFSSTHVEMVALLEKK